MKRATCTRATIRCSLVCRRKVCRKVGWSTPSLRSSDATYSFARESYLVHVLRARCQPCLGLLQDQLYSAKCRCGSKQFCSPQSRRKPCHESQQLIGHWKVPGWVVRSPCKAPSGFCWDLVALAASTQLGHITGEVYVTACAAVAV
eukprot:506929-Amphidinium_carterae.1